MKPSRSFGWLASARITLKSPPNSRIPSSNARVSASTPSSSGSTSGMRPATPEATVGDMKADTAPTYRDVPFVSTDSHVTEPIEIYAERVDKKYRDRAPKIESRNGWRTLIVEGMDPRKLMTADELEVAIVGGTDPEERYRD